MTLTTTTTAAMKISLQPPFIHPMSLIPRLKVQHLMHYILYYLVHFILILPVLLATLSTIMYASSSSSSTIVNVQVMPMVQHMVQHPMFINALIAITNLLLQYHNNVPRRSIVRVYIPYLKCRHPQVQLVGVMVVVEECALYHPMGYEYTLVGVWYYYPLLHRLVILAVAQDIIANLQH